MIGVLKCSYYEGYTVMVGDCSYGISFLTKLNPLGIGTGSKVKGELNEFDLFNIHSVLADSK